jgi:AraC-like DNA-binding protein
MSLVLIYAGRSRISLAGQTAFPGGVEEGWEYRVADDDAGHFEVAECEWEGMEFQMVSWRGGGDGRILIRGGLRKYVMIAVIEGSCKIGWDGAGRQFHERGANVLEGVTGFIPMERQLPGNLTFFRIGFDRPPVVERELNRRGWGVNPNLLTNKSVLEMLTPFIMNRAIMPERSFVWGAIQSLVNYLFSGTALVYQHCRISISTAAWFYEQKRRLNSQASFPGAFAELIRKADIENIVRFRRLLRQLYGYRVRDLLREQRMVIAVRLLRETDLSIKEIAGMSGYRNVFYFTRVFSDFFREPPGAFQKRHRR